MEREYFQSIENCPDSTELDLQQVIDNLAFDERGLLPVITQDANSKDVLMMAWMNKDTIQETLRTGFVTYWSRSRQQRWVKGETSGHTQELVSLSIDCDGDAILCQVNQKGAACHTGRPHCFYLEVDKQKILVTDPRSTTKQ